MIGESTLATGLAWGGRGHAVVPVWWPVPDKAGRLVCACRKGRECGRSSGKHPIAQIGTNKPVAPNGLLSASTESGVIKHWWGILCPSANLGVVTDRLIVLDVDDRHGGNESLAALEREHGELPPTWRSITGSLGQHIIYACPPGVTVHNVQPLSIENGQPVYSRPPPLGPGIDIRGQGGYIVSPPSRHISGRSYSWSVDHHPSETPLVEPPVWMLDRLAEPSPNSRSDQRTTSEEWATFVPAAKITEYRDAAAAKVAGHLFRRWVEPHLVSGLMAAWNLAYLLPPLSDFELSRILERIARREAERRDRQTAQADDEELREIALLLGVRP